MLSNEEFMKEENEKITIKANAETNKDDKQNIDKKKEWLRILKFVLFSISAGAIQMVSSLLLT